MYDEIDDTSRPLPKINIAKLSVAFQLFAAFQTIYFRNTKYLADNILIFVHDPMKCHYSKSNCAGADPTLSNEYRLPPSDYARDVGMRSLMQQHTQLYSEQQRKR